MFFQKIEEKIRAEFPKTVFREEVIADAISKTIEAMEEASLDYFLGWSRCDKVEDCIAEAARDGVGDWAMFREWPLGDRAFYIYADKIYGTVICAFYDYDEETACAPADDADAPF